MANNIKKAQRIKPTLYDGIFMSDKHVAMLVIDDEETLILEEESKSRILTEDFRKRFTLQQELSAEQAFWLRMPDPTSKPSDALPIKIEAPKELTKISLVNESLKKLKFHLAKFNNVVKIRTTPNARTEGSGCSKHMTGNHSQLMNFVSKFLSTIRFENDHIARIMGYGDYQLGNVTISRVYYVEGLEHNLFSIGQFSDADLEVAFRKNICFIRNLEGKSKKSSHQPKAEDTNQEKLYLLHMDLCGPMRVASINGK
nr:integrase, catalytic region, zinc finger, CCHC-type, peptidase aspartic, catalytic [Tanacetum cinerariifolium]